MDGSRENNALVGKPIPTFRGMQSGKAAINSRKPLGDIGNFACSNHPFQPAICKRGIPEKHVKNPSIGLNKNQSVAAIHRPITRRFAASLATTTKDEQFCPQGYNKKHPLVENVASELKHKRSISSCSSSNSLTNFAVSDLEKTNATNGFSLQTESMVVEIEPVEECHKIQEVEMELVPDIDSCDFGNPLAVVEYIEDIYCFYRKIENSGCVCPDYMSNQTDINEKMRAILIDWLIEVHYKFELMDETLFLTVNLIDRFLACQTVMRKKLQLVGVTAMLLACKYEEVSVPVVEDMILISDRAYTKEEIIEMEKLMVNTLQFKFSVPTPYVFMKRSLKAAQSDKMLELLSFYIIELCFVEYEMLKYCPSLLATAAVYTAQCAIKGFKYWTSAFEWHTNYSEDQLLECSRLMVGFHQKAGFGKLTGVYRKYNTSRFGFAAKAQAASFLLYP